MYRFDSHGTRRAGMSIRFRLPHSTGGSRNGRDDPQGHREGARCFVCGSTKLDMDEVFTGKTLLLGECRHCSHRWTEVLSPVYPGAGMEAVSTSTSRAA